VAEYAPETGRGSGWISYAHRADSDWRSYRRGPHYCGSSKVSSTYVRTWLTAAVGGDSRAQIYRNDSILRAIMHWAGLQATAFVRDQHVGSVDESEQPDFTALNIGVPILLVQEKEEDDLNGAQADIVDKFAWIPYLRRLPFFTGIAFCSRYVSVLLLRPNEPAEIVFSTNCDSQDERRAFLRPAVNTARVLKLFLNFVLGSGVRMNVWHERADDKWLRLGLKVLTSDVPEMT
jgi:hypothetical protein